MNNKYKINGYDIHFCYAGIEQYTIYLNGKEIQTCWGLSDIARIINVDAETIKNEMWKQDNRKVENFMTAEELDKMVNAMRTKYNKVEMRTDVTDMLYYLCKGLTAIGKNELAEELDELCGEIDSIDTGEIVKIGTFK